MERGGFDVMLLTDTKIHTDTYPHNCLGYDVTCSKARPARIGPTDGGLNPHDSTVQIW